MRKKLLKKLKKALKEAEEGKTEIFSIEQIRERFSKRVEKEKHFPHCLKKYCRTISIKINRGWWHLRGVIWDRHNVVKMKTLPPTWSDADTKLLHASFAIFCDVIEKEKIFDYDNYDYSKDIEEMENEVWDNEDDRLKTISDLKKSHEEAQAFEKEAKYLYGWWKVLRLSREDNDDMDGALYEEDTEHLIRLMKIRKRLWT